MAVTEVAGETTLTAKNQVSLPARGLRRLGWERGDRLIVHVLGRDSMLLTRRPDNPAEFYAGKLGHVFGTHEENLRFLEEERASWNPLAAAPASSTQQTRARKVAGAPRQTKKAAPRPTSGPSSRRRKTA